MARKMGNVEAAILVLVFFALGTSNTIVTKVIFTLQGKGSDGQWKPFHKPAFGNWNMFFGMFLVIFVHLFFQYRQTRVAPDMPDAATALNDQKSPMSVTKQVSLIAIPAVFDIFGTGLSLVGIILIPASVWQMLRGAEIVFAALLTVFVLRRRLYGYHWMGVASALLGIICVSTATIMGGSVGSDGSSGGGGAAMTFGVAITLISQVIQAAQIIAEEKLLVDLQMSTLLVVGVEGIWGLLIMTVVVYPILYFCPGPDSEHLADPLDTIAMIQSSRVIITFVILDFVSCAVYNVVGQKITQDMSGMMRVMLEATRTLCVWVFNLIWYYLVDPNSLFGERWTGWSYLELLGFIFLIVGQTTYGEVLKLPGFYYPPATPAGSPARFQSPIRLKGACLASPINVGLCDVDLDAI
jgi:drug/metabolite transporter (DMT)-like permease